MRVVATSHEGVEDRHEQGIEQLSDTQRRHVTVIGLTQFGFRLTGNCVVLNVTETEVDFGLR